MFCHLLQEEIRMIRERIAEPSCKHIQRDLTLARFANACRGFHPGRGMVSLLVLLVVMTLPVVAFAGDPTGAGTGNAETITAAKPGEPTIQEVADAVGHTIVSANFIWTLVAGFLVMFMQAGFALAETGFTRAKNAAHTMTMNFMVYGLGILGLWVYGFVGSAIIYPIFGAWAWGGGWLSTLGKYVGLGHGYFDFAGSGGSTSREA